MVTYQWAFADVLPVNSCTQARTEELAVSAATFSENGLFSDTESGDF
jgi:hypothetical protein